MKDYHCKKCGSRTFVVCTDASLNDGYAAVEVWCEDPGCNEDKSSADTLEEAFEKFSKKKES
jgi:hypothetical protein